METITINVTENHIKRGRRLSPTACPIALAIKEQVGDHPIVGGAAYWTVSKRRFLVTKRQSFTAELPMSAMLFMARFDTAGRGLSPFSFELTPRLAR